jgi:hypothetical protein
MVVHICNLGIWEAEVGGSQSKIGWSKTKDLT